MEMQMLSIQYNLENFGGWQRILAEAGESEVRDSRQKGQTIQNYKDKPCHREWSWESFLFQLYFAIEKEAEL